MMTLKKAFETQNNFKSLMTEAGNILLSNDNVTTVTQTHLRKKYNSEAEDETIIKPKHNHFDFTINDLLDFICYLENEIEKLTDAICDAKQSFTKDYERSYDAMISTNAHKRNIIMRLNLMAKIKSSEVMTVGRSVKFNNDGNQVEYKYDIKEVTDIDFDRNKVKGIISKLGKEADKTSEDIDKMTISSCVDYDCPFDMNDSLEDIILAWCDTKK